jgi:hypothetical protein
MPDFVDQLLMEVETADDRAAIIIGSVFLEKYLAQYIKKYLPKPNDKYANEILFTDGNGFRSFKTKIFWAYTAGIIGPKTQQDLDTIRGIRNIALNEMHPISFHDEAIVEKCREIHCVSKSKNNKIEILNSRLIYIQAIRTLLSAIIDRLSDEENADPLPDTMET